MPRPLLIHTHGIRHLDYSSIDPDQLFAVNAYAAEAGLDVLPAVFLARDGLDELTDLAHTYHRWQHRLDHVLGFSIEGPLLGDIGGVPPVGIWRPTAAEWERIAALGELGLRYIVLAPDGGELDDRVDAGASYRDIVDLFYQRGVRIALGHFRNSDPKSSAARIRRMIDHIQEHHGPRADLLLTDHLYNDMPRNFTHVLRTSAERASRRVELDEFLAKDWDDDSLDELLGAVPAALLRAAKQEELLPFLNFDGDHVAPEVCKRTLDYLGLERVIGITDDTARPSLAGEELQRRDDNGLWYRSDGAVAAGTGDFERQKANLRQIGFGEDDISQLFSTNPRRALSPVHE